MSLFIVYYLIHRNLPLEFFSYKLIRLPFANFIFEKLDFSSKREV